MRISPNNGLWLLGARGIVCGNAWYVLAVKAGPLVDPMKRTQLELDGLVQCPVSTPTKGTEID